jgi:hypothetical protein
MRPLLILLTLATLVTGCQLPVSPLVNFTPYSNPYVPKENFETQFTAWKAGRSVPWTITYQGTGFSAQELIIASDGKASMGGQLPGTNNEAAFTITKSDLTKMVDAVIATGMFGLYDGHYGAWTQAGGAGGPQIRVTIGGLEKRVSKYTNLDIGWEADAIQKASDAIASTALKYLK